MTKLYPLKTLVISNSNEEADAIIRFAKKYPHIFSIKKVTGSIFDLIQILSAESFELTFFDETFISLDLVERFGKNRFGIIVFRNRKTLSWNHNLLAKDSEYYALEPPFYLSGPELIKKLTERTEVNESSLPNKYSNRRIPFKIERIIHYIPENNIICVSCIDKICTIYYEDETGIKHFSQWSSLTEIENKLDPDIFFRTDRPYLVNLAHVDSLNSMSNTLTFPQKFQEKIPKITISEPKRRILMQKRK